MRYLLILFLKSRGIIDPDFLHKVAYEYTPLSEDTIVRVVAANAKVPHETFAAEYHAFCSTQLEAAING
jgi:hypothetical protein